MPWTPCTPSMIRAATSPLASSARTAAKSFSGRKVTGKFLLMGALIFSLSVTLTAAEVRPWKAPSKARMRLRFVWKLASFSAFSVASAPLDTRKSW